MTELLAVACEAALDAGRYVQSHIGGQIGIRSEEGSDIKLELDFLTEERIVRSLRAQSDFGIISEESAPRPASLSSDYTWIVDPIDGSLNFSRNIPFFCVSIGLWKDGEPVLGAVYDIPHEVLYCGAIGLGSWRNDLPLAVSNITEKGRGVLATGFPVYLKIGSEALAEFGKKLAAYKKVRLFGSAALSILMVAQGSVEAYQEDRIALWDVAGAVPIVLGAGGRCTFAAWDSNYLTDVHASNGRLTA